MSSVAACRIPENSLLDAYRRSGSYADCYVTEIAGSVPHAQYVEAFYTTGLFKLERFILSWALAKPSTDHEALELAQGRRESFAAWQVEARAQDELLLAAGRTRSWLMVVTGDGPREARTRLYFGSAVVPGKRARKGSNGLGPVFGALLGFHKLYSRALLQMARRRLEGLCR